MCEYSSEDSGSSSNICSPNLAIKRELYSGKNIKMCVYSSEDDEPMETKIEKVTSDTENESEYKKSDTFVKNSSIEYDSGVEKYCKALDLGDFDSESKDTSCDIQVKYYESENKTERKLIENIKKENNENKCSNNIRKHIDIAFGSHHRGSSNPKEYSDYEFESDGGMSDWWDDKADYKKLEKSNMDCNSHKVKVDCKHNSKENVDKVVKEISRKHSKKHSNHKFEIVKEVKDLTSVQEKYAITNEDQTRTSKGIHTKYKTKEKSKISKKQNIKKSTSKSTNEKKKDTHGKKNHSMDKVTNNVNKEDRVYCRTKSNDSTDVVPTKIAVDGRTSSKHREKHRSKYKDGKSKYMDCKENKQGHSLIDSKPKNNKKNKALNNVIQENDSSISTECTSGCVDMNKGSLQKAITDIKEIGMNEVINKEIHDEGENINNQCSGKCEYINAVSYEKKKNKELVNEDVGTSSAYRNSENMNIVNDEYWVNTETDCSEMEANLNTSSLEDGECSETETTNDVSDEIETSDYSSGDSSGDSAYTFIYCTESSEGEISSSRENREFNDFESSDESELSTDGSSLTITDEDDIVEYGFGYRYMQRKDSIPQSEYMQNYHKYLEERCADEQAYTIYLEDKKQRSIARKVARHEARVAARIELPPVAVPSVSSQYAIATGSVARSQRNSPEPISLDFIPEATEE